TRFHDRSGSVIDFNRARRLGIFGREVFLWWISARKKRPARTRTAHRFGPRGNGDLFRVALSPGENPESFDRPHARSTTLRGARIDEKIRGVSTRDRRRIARALRKTSSERRNRAADFR